MDFDLSVTSLHNLSTTDIVCAPACAPLILTSDIFPLSLHFFLAISY